MISSISYYYYLLLSYYFIHCGCKFSSNHAPKFLSQILSPKVGIPLHFLRVPCTVHMGKKAKSVFSECHVGDLNSVNKCWPLFTFPFVSDAWGRTPVGASLETMLIFRVKFPCFSFISGCRVLWKHLQWTRPRCLGTFTTNCWATRWKMSSSNASCQNASQPRDSLISTTLR